MPALASTPVPARSSRALYRTGSATIPRPQLLTLLDFPKPMSLSVRRLKRFLWAKLMARMHLDWTLRSGVRVMIRSYSDWCSYNEIFVNDEYTVPIRDAIASATGPLRVLDLGANFGYFTLKLADMCSLERKGNDLTVWMVEGSPAVCDELKRRITHSQAKMEWTVTHGLVGKRTGTARFNFAKEDNQNFVDESEQRGMWARKGGAEEMSYVDVAALAGDSPVVDLIKCDIEGSEFDFIANYPDLLKKTARLVIEFHTAFGSVAEASDRLKQLGFGSRVLLRDDEKIPTFYFTRT